MLTSLIVKNLLQRPLRYLLTGLSITFGVAAVTAVFIFTGGLRSSFDDIAETIEAGYDVEIQTTSAFGDGFERATLDPKLATEMEALPEVSVVQPRIYEFGVTLQDDAEGALVGLGLNWEDRTPEPRLFLIEGKIPTNKQEFIIDVDSFAGGDLTLGKEYKVATPSGAIDSTLVGTFSQGAIDTNTAFIPLYGFDEATAFDLLNGGSGYDKITMVLEPDQDPEKFIEKIQPILDAKEQNLEALTLAEAIEETQGDFGEALDIFTKVLLAFSVIILLVATFLVFNVFNITLGQRVKELGLLRALGAEGTQISQLMFAEALVLGVVATIIGIPAGWGLAWLLRFGLVELGFPNETGLPVHLTTILLAGLVGIVVTLLAAFWPSVKARQTSPMAALSEVEEASDKRQPNYLLAVVSFAVATALTILTFVLELWQGKLLLPVAAGLGFYLCFIWLGSLAAKLAPFAMFGFGLVLLTVARFAEFSLGETFSLLGSAAMLTIVGGSLVSSLVASPVGKALGWHPTAVIVLLVGIAFALAPIGLIAAAVSLAAENSAGWLLLIGIPFCLLGGYTLARTGYGGLGLTGRLGRDNAARNPQRTATTATAMMIGLALVTAVTVVGDSIKTSVTEALGSSITSDFIVQTPVQNGPRVPLSPEVRERLEALPEIERATSNRVSREGLLSISGDVDADEIKSALPEIFLNFRDEAKAAELQERLGISRISPDVVFATDLYGLDDVVDPSFVSRDDSLLNANSVYIADEIAEDRNLRVGDTFVSAFLDGQVEELTVAGIYRNGFVLGPLTIQTELWNKHIDRQTDDFVNLLTADGVSEEQARNAVEAELAVDYSNLVVMNRQEFSDEAENQINIFLAAINVLLMLSAAIAVLGIAVALSLAVFERTREIGLLRAIGTTRQQTRWMIRWEGVIIAAFGGLVGVVLGVGLGVLAAEKMPEVLVLQTSVPWELVVLYLLAAALTGLGAGAFPAWVAGRLNVLEAISTE